METKSLNAVSRLVYVLLDMAEYDLSTHSGNGNTSIIARSERLLQKPLSKKFVSDWIKNAQTAKIEYIYRFDVAANKAEVFRKADVSFQPEDYVSEQLFYTSKDGTKVPMFITYKKGMQKTGKNPFVTLRIRRFLI